MHIFLIRKDFYFLLRLYFTFCPKNQKEESLSTMILFMSIYNWSIDDDGACGLQEKSSSEDIFNNRLFLVIASRECIPKESIII